jgi:hypothetical protein
MIRAVGLAFSAMNVESHVQTKQQLEAEANIGQLSDVSKTSGIKETAVAPNSNEKTVVFADPVNGNLVKLNLSNENIDKLKKHFGGEDNFYERKDGTLRLNGDAEAYVSGWFGDIAYKREFLKADADGNGKLNNEEYQNTKNDFIGQGEAHGAGKNIISIKEEITEQYVSVGTNVASLIKYHQTGKQSVSIEEELNKTLKADSNKDGNLNLKEAYSVSGKEYSEIISTHAKQVINKHNTMYGERENPFKDKSLEELGYYIEKTDSKEAQKALEKLKAANGDESVLNADEREALEVEISKMKEQQADLNSVKEGIKISVEATRFIDVKG